MKKKLLVITLMVIMALSQVTAYASDGTSFVYDGYIYDFWGNALESPAAFELETVIDVDNLEGIKLLSVNDVCTSKDGRIFITDTLESRVNVLDGTGKLLKSLKVIRDDNNKIVTDAITGNQLILTSPEGAFVHEKNQELFIADTGAGRIVVLDSVTYSFKRIIERPDNMTGVTEFKPSKITVDKADRIYVVVQSSYEGIVELNEDGSFSRYFGVNSPKVNLIDYFWKSIASDEQKAQMAKTFAPAFNNVALDGEGFVLAVTFDSASMDMVFRLNSGGKNVLREEGNTPVIGDIHGMNNFNGSQFVDIAVTDYGTYAVIDKAMGRIFLYNFDGELLNAFGIKGKLKGEFQMPSGIAWLDEKLVVTDSTLKCAYILKPTDFGSAALKASENYYYGLWDEALEYFYEAVRLNANYEIAYTGIGKNYLMKDEYKSAMYYFKLGNNSIFYSKAYNGYRSEVLKDNFGIIAILFLIVIVSVVVSEIRYHKKGGMK
jgi:hypothetical protein